jgi:hypothetical protein
MSVQPFGDLRKMMSIEAMIDQAGAIELPGFMNVLMDPEPEAKSQKELEQEALSKAIFRVFQTDDGRALFEWLLDNTLRKPLVFPSIVDNQEKHYPMACAREGMNALVMLILQQIALAQEAPMPIR